MFQKHAHVRCITNSWPLLIAAKGGLLEAGDGYINIAPELCVQLHGGLETIRQRSRTRRLPSCSPVLSIAVDEISRAELLLAVWRWSPH